MKILAIDTSCDETCAAIVDASQWKLLADTVVTHTEPMTRFGGIVPEIASREHLRTLPDVIHRTLGSARLGYEDLDHITVTHRPGLIGALLVGVSYAKALAYSLQKPFSVQDHIQSHLFSPCLASFEGQSVPPFPWVALVVSGGHTELFIVESVTSFRWLGGTVDDAAGEAFDKIGKLLGLNYPAGPQLDRWVREQASPSDRTRFSFPRSRPSPYHFSFSGLKTAVANQLNKTPELSQTDKLAFAASAQEAILDPLIDQLQAAQNEFGISQIVVTGGVACNSRLRERLPKAYFPSPKHCSDNAAMVALRAAQLHRAGNLPLAPWTVTPFAFSELG